MELKNWYPVSLSKDLDKSLCKWIYFADTPLTDPFFEESRSKVMSHQINSKPFRVWSSLQLMQQWAREMESIPPKAIIFHASRCGSTLLAQLLGSNSKHISLAEVPFFDDLLRRYFFAQKEQKEELLQFLESAIHFYGQKRNGIEEQLFIKTDSWHFFFWKEYRQLYPTVPFALLYRHPLEIFLSHQKLKGMQAVPGLIEPEIFGMTTKEIELLNQEEYLGKVLEKYYLKIMEIYIQDQNSILISYKEGIMEIIQKFYSFIRLPLHSVERDEFYQRQKFNAKNPQELFIEEESTIDLPIYLQRSLQLYEELEQIRLKNSEDLKPKI